MIMTVALASANSVRYFTRAQAARVAAELDSHNELMIYCGYEYELATYVIINEVWYEPVNSKYNEIWLFGYDAYTGEEIYMPIDLACIWLYNPYGNRMYSAAQYLRFRSSVTTPNFYWTMPPYNPFTRHFHDPMFNHGYTYHYEIHRYGWRPPMHSPHGPALYHPYYMRTPHTPAPVPTKPFTPGLNHPDNNGNYSYIDNGRNNGGTRSSTLSRNTTSRSGNNYSNPGNNGTTSRTTTNTTNRSNTTTNTTNRSNATTNTTNRGNATTETRGSNTTETRGNNNTSTNTRNNSTTENRGTSTNTNRTTNNNTTTTRGNATTETRGTSTTTTRTTNNSTTTRGTSTNTTTRGTSTNTSTRGTSTNTNTRGTSTTNNRGTSNRGSR